MGMGGNGTAVSVISPDNTPDYQLEIYDPDGFIVVPLVQIMTQYARIDVPFSTLGRYLIKIHDAIDDGIYKVKPFFTVKPQ